MDSWRVFNGRFRDESLNETLFSTLTQAASAGSPGQHHAHQIRHQYQSQRLPVPRPARIDSIKDVRQLLDRERLDLAPFDQRTHLICLDACDFGCGFGGQAALGETGTYRVEFLNGHALSAELFVRDGDAMQRMVARLPEWSGAQTLVYIRTKNTEVDTIKAVHDLGKEAAIERFSRYLAGDGSRDLASITFVPLEPPAEQQFADAKTYLDSLPPGGVMLSLWRLDGASMLSVTLPKADRKELFPQYCDESCANWSIPEAKEGSD